MGFPILAGCLTNRQCKVADFSGRVSDTIQNKKQNLAVNRVSTRIVDFFVARQHAK
jgi:hypothetical protein